MAPNDSIRPNRLLPVALDDPRLSHDAVPTDLTMRQVLPVVAQRQRASDRYGTAMGVALVAMLGAGTLFSLSSARENRAARPAVVAAPAPATPPGVTVPVAAVTPAPPPPAPAYRPPPSPRTVLAAPPSTAPGTLPSGNPLASPTVLFDASALPAPAAAPAVAPPAGGNGNDEFAARVGGVGGTTAVAVAAADPRTTVTQGTLIPAILETAVDTDVPGYVRAMVSADVRSFDGTRVLVPRSSRLIGQYRSGVQAGQKRVYVVWTRLMRPDGVSVALASPAVGFGGDTGLAGKVDTHFFQRFGSAMLLSVVGGLSAIGSGGAGLITGGGSSAAAAAVGQSGQIGPTIRVRPGEPIRVFTARDLDFSKVATQ